MRAAALFKSFIIIQLITSLIDQAAVSSTSIIITTDQIGLIDHCYLQESSNADPDVY